MVTYQIRKAKSNLYANLIEQNKGNSKILWQVLKSASNFGSNKSTPKLIKNDSGSFTKPSDDIAASIFNSHFMGIANTVFAESAVRPDDPLDDNIFVTVNRFVNERAPTGIPLLTIPQVSQDFLSKQIEKLSPNKAKGIDSLNVKLLKLAKPVILPPLIYIYNLSISSGIFPHQWKTAKVTPIHKAGPKDDPDNYRPISVLSPLSKIFERHVSPHLLDHLNKHNLLSDFQYGSRPSHSCETLLLKLTDEWLAATDKGHSLDCFLWTSEKPLTSLTIEFSSKK